MRSPGLRLVLAAVIALSAAPPVHAQATPAPDAVLAPEDLTFLFPRRIGDVGLVTQRGGGAEMLDTTTDQNFAVYREILLAVGKEPSDFRLAAAYNADPSALEQYYFFAVRIDGIAADEVVKRWFQALANEPGSDLPPDFEGMPGREIAGRTVFTFQEEDASDWAVVYPVGEVMFMLFGNNAATIEEVLAELP